MNNNWTRKQFLKASLVGGGAAIIAGPTRRYGQVAPVAGSANDDIRVAVVGFNKQGAGHYRNYLPGSQSKLKGARLVALCDVDSDVLARGKADAEKAGLKVETYADYRKLLENKGIDAVVIATPNHQHSLQSIWGLQAGKDVYCEKPLSHNVWEGRQAVEAAKKYTKNILVTGTQNRSSEDIVEAIALIRSGKLGKIQWARGLCYKERRSIDKSTKAQRVMPSTINYDLWSGPAPIAPLSRNTPENGPIHYDWHWFWNYGGGDIANQGIHQMDVARWVLGEAGLPPSVMCIGGRFGYDDDAETPNTQMAVFGYEKAPLIFEVRGLPQKAGTRAMDAYRGTRVGVVVQCEQGYITISEAGTCIVYDNNNNKVQTFAKNTLGQHRPNWIKAIRERKVTHGLAEECHYSSALCHLANVSYQVGGEKTNAEIAESIKASEVTKETFGRMLEHLKANAVDVDKTNTVIGPKLAIDVKAEKFVGSEPFVAAANQSALLKREGRGEFKIPVMQNGAVAAS